MKIDLLKAYKESCSLSFCCGWHTFHVLPVQTKGPPVQSLKGCNLFPRPLPANLQPTPWNVNSLETWRPNLLDKPASSTTFADMQHLTSLSPRFVFLQQIVRGLTSMAGANLSFVLCFYDDRGRTVKSQQQVVRMLCRLQKLVKWYLASAKWSIINGPPCYSMLTDQHREAEDSLGASLR